MNKTCLVLLTNEIDFKDFVYLMEKHEIEIIYAVSDSKEGRIFKLKESEETVEEIMIETHMEWEFSSAEAQD